MRHQAIWDKYALYCHAPVPADDKEVVVFTDALWAYGLTKEGADKTYAKIIGQAGFDPERFRRPNGSFNKIRSPVALVQAIVSL